MGVVVEFGVPMVRARRRSLDGYCEVTVFPDRDTCRRPAPAPAAVPARRTAKADLPPSDRRPSVEARP